MNFRIGFADALHSIRKARGLKQEDFSDVSSRTYLSTLERGLKSPTLEKINQLAVVLNVHPLTLLTLAYARAESIDTAKVIDTVIDQIDLLAEYINNEN